MVIRRLTPDIAYNRAKFDDSSFSNSSDIKGVQNYMDGHEAITTPLSGRFVADRLGHAMINLATKFEVPIFTRCSIKCDAKCRQELISR